MVINSITLTTAAYTLDAKQYISDITRPSLFPRQNAPQRTV